MHFGNTATSRVEGIHALLKSYLKTSKFDLFDVWRSIKHAVENQLSELRSTQARQHTRKPTEHLDGGLFSALHGWISHEAIKKVEEQRKLLEKTDPPVSSVCTGTFTRSYGLPCVHKMKLLQDQNQGLHIDDFHKQWRLIRNGAQPRPILEPSRVESGIRNRPTIAQSSTQREPSAFERCETRAPKCSRCHAIGHSRRSKACPLWQQEVLLESSIPHIAGPSAIPLALAGWSQEAEDALFSQVQGDMVNAPLGPLISQVDETLVSKTQDVIVVQDYQSPLRHYRYRNQSHQHKITILCARVYPPKICYIKECLVRKAVRWKHQDKPAISKGDGITTTI